MESRQYHSLTAEEVNHLHVLRALTPSQRSKVIGKCELEYERLVAKLRRWILPRRRA